MAPNTEYITSKSSTVDKLLGGGLTPGTTCLLEELSGEDRGISGYLGISYIVKGLEDGKHAILFLTEHTVSEYKGLMRFLKVDLNGKLGKLLFLESLTSMRIGEPPHEEPDESVIRISNIRYSAKLFEEFIQGVERLERPRIFIDSLSVLLNAMASDDVAWKFWLNMLPIVRERQITVISSFYPEMHSTRFVQSIERISDTIIRMSSSNPEPNQSPIRFIRLVKHRRSHFDERMLEYTRSGLDLQVKS
ncbi:MAG: RAD55 family ATPase [Promethearchaeota archaeon]